MRKGAIILIVLAFLLSLAACQGNIFMKWDKIEIPSADDMTDKASNDPDGFISDVEDYLDSDSITKENAGDMATALKEVYDPDPNSPPSDETEEQAALLLGEVSLKQDENAETFVGNVSSALTDLESMEDDDISSIMDTLTDGTDALDSQENFESMVGALVDSSDGYLAFGSGLDETTSDDLSYMDSGEAGDAAQQTLITTMVKASLDALDGTIDGTIGDETFGKPSESPEETLYAIITDGDETWDDTYGDPTTVFDDPPPSGYEGLDNVLALGGLDGMF